VAVTVTGSGEYVTATIGEEAAIPELAAVTVRNGGRLMSMVPQRETLEDLFIRVVQSDGKA
jgi:hypothetical protein